MSVVVFSCASGFCSVSVDDAVGFPVTLSQLNVTVEDPQGDSFYWSIETSPDIGSDSGIGEFNGTKTCSISGLDYNTSYTWFVKLEQE